jgi:hypothetical protein
MIEGEKKSRLILIDILEFESPLYFIGLTD